ncbi:universal stress protein [Streptomyces sp. NPDC002574]|uniref:universal stress protein n=1 Tax=Streptomyces sp. NPDC002574 TaxID=3364652 RepID=UPI00369537B2
MRESREDRVVVGVSGSLGSLVALHRAVEEARRRSTALTVVIAWETVGVDFGSSRPPSPPLLDRWHSLARRQLFAALDTAFGGSIPLDPPLRPVIALGLPGPTLVRVADQESDLLVVGTGSHGPLRRLLSPSVARHCLAHARCPVLAVPPPPLMSELVEPRRRGSRARLGLGHRPNGSFTL